MHTYTATIGRNISAAHPTRAHQPLTLTEWEDFILAVVEDMRASAETSSYGAEMTIEVHRGKGMWNGVEEESAKIALLVEESLTDHAYAMLLGCLKFDARQYGQDAIAFVTGESELIEPDAPRNLPATLINGEKVGPAVILGEVG